MDYDVHIMFNNDQSAVRKINTTSNENVKVVKLRLN